MADQFECNDCSNTSSGAAEAADRCHRITVVKVRRQYVRDGSERCIRKSRYREQRRDQVEISSKDSRNKQCDAEACKNHQRLASSAECPAALNQISRHSPTEQVSEIGGNKGDPDGD